MESSDHVMGLQATDTEIEPKLAQLDNVLYTWFTVAWSEGKPVTGPVITDRAKYFYEALTADKSTPI